MNLAEEKLNVIDAQLKKGVAPSNETTRAFLLWFGVERRGWRVVRTIRQALKTHGIVTVPDFEYSYIDGPIGFTKAPAEAAASTDLDSTATDPTYRLSRLEAANRVPVSVGPDATLQQAVTLMMTKDFSQLPVIVGTREVKGVISWKSLGSRLALKRPCTKVADCMETARIVQFDESLFAAIETIEIYDYVLVQAKDKTICGIVTAADFNNQFRLLAEPFLLVGEIENGIRKILHAKFTSGELLEAKAPGDDGRDVGAVTDLNFGEYIRLIEPEKRWKKLRLEVDRVEFLSSLNRVREIRNDVMHFDPEGLSRSDMEILRDFAKFLKQLRDVGAI